jgi:PadR family transcriptional regulator PadR
MVLSTLMQDPDGRHYGYQISKWSGVRSGVLYPILHRMLDEGWVTDGWEQIDPSEKKRPPRRYYRLTDVGRAEAERRLSRKTMNRPSS